jgi:FtsZ-binding cell division protein ZapB
MSERATSVDALRMEVARLKVRLLEAQRDASASSEIARELTAENVSLGKDLREWQRIAAARAERIVALEQGR